MTHEVYISFDDIDKVTAISVYEVLEDNGIECWIRFSDAGEDEIHDTFEAIQKSKVMVLLYSMNARDSNRVYTEALTAFDEEITIVVFNVDNTKLSGGLEFILHHVNHWLNISPQPEEEFKRLVIDVSNILGKPVDNPKINPEVKSYIDELKVEIEDPEARKRGIRLLLVFTIFVPIILIAISFATFDISGNIGTLLFLLAIVFFIGTPVFYLIYNYMMR